MREAPAIDHVAEHAWGYRGCALSRWSCRDLGDRHGLYWRPDLHSDVSHRRLSQRRHPHVNPFAIANFAFDQKPGDLMIVLERISGQTIEQRFG